MKASRRARLETRPVQELFIVGWCSFSMGRNSVPI